MNDLREQIIAIVREEEDLESVAEPVNVGRIADRILAITTPPADAGLRAALALARSMMLSGEKMSAQAEAMFDAALAPRSSGEPAEKQDYCDCGRHEDGEGNQIHYPNCPLYKKPAEPGLREAAPASEGWIPVSERLPEEPGHYFVFTKNRTKRGGKGNGIFWWDGKPRSTHPKHARMWDIVTHWMPLPEPPQEVGNKKRRQP